MKIWTILFLIILSIPVFGAFSELDKSTIPLRNLLTNPGFEANKSTWSVTGGIFNMNTVAANIGSGNASASWDASASGQFFQSLAISIPPGLYGQNGTATCNIKGAGATHALQAYDGTSVLATAAITSTANYSVTSVNFTFPTSGTIQLRIKSNADEPLIYIDDCYLGAPTSNTVSLLTSAWSGYHGSDCLWSITQNTYAADYPIDATCTFTQRTNVNFGTVTSANDGTPGNNRPGITFTPTAAGLYYACAIITARADDNTTNISYELFDGATVVSDKPLGTQGQSIRNPLPLCGLYTASSVSPVTLKVRGQSGTGFNEIDASNTTSNAIEWSIFKVDQQFPAPLWQNSITSNSSGVERINRVTVADACTTATCTIVNQSGSWVSSIARTGGGNYTFTIAPGEYSVAPTCLCTPRSATNGILCWTQNAPTTTSFNIVTQVGVANTDSGFNVVCMGPK